LLSQLPRCLAVFVLVATLTTPWIGGGRMADATAQSDPGPATPRLFPRDYGPDGTTCFSPLRVPLGATGKEPYLVLNVAARQLYVYSDQTQSCIYPTAVGRLEYHTPIGRFSIIGKATSPTWYPGDGSPPVPPGPQNPLGTRWMGWSWGGYGLHGTNADWSIGHAVSLGCVRLHNADAEQLFDLVKIGTPLDVIYEPVELAVFPARAAAPDPPPSLDSSAPAAPTSQAPGLVLTLYPDFYKRIPNYATFLAARLNLAGYALPAETVTGLLEILGRLGEVSLDTASPVLLGCRLVDTPILRLDRDSGDVPLVAVRAVAGALDQDVGWDEAAGQVLLSGARLSPVILGGRAYARLDDLAKALATNLDWAWETVVSEETAGNSDDGAGGVSSDPAMVGEAAGTESGASAPTASPSRLLRYKLTLYPGLVYVNGYVISRQAFRRADGTYVSLRAVAQALGLSVQWDPARCLAVIGGRPVPAVLVDGRSFARDADLAGALIGLASLQVTPDGVFITR
jgi:hypothetical protein